MKGSVLDLGPILFIIYFNDITHPTLFDGGMTLFADDIMIYRPICTPEDLAMLQSGIDSLTSWTEQNFLLQHGMGLYVKPMEVQELLSFLFRGGRKSYALFYKCIFRRDFLSPAYCNSLGYRKLFQRLHVLLL